MNKRPAILIIVLTLLTMPLIIGNAKAASSESQPATIPTGSGDLTIGQIIALTVSAAVALIGLWLYFRPKNKSEKINKTAITPRRLQKMIEN
jgi:hypothetical protein